jgi:hypothetical protein
VTPRAAAVLGVAAALALAGCGGAAAPPPAPTVAPRSTIRASPSPSAPVRERRSAGVPRARCPAGTPGCAAVRGRVVYVERVDPDGDGDLHVVVLAGRVTAPGATAIDVSVDLRPRHDPRIGDVVSAAGPVQRGHLDQSQIHALVFHAQRR